MVSVVPTPTVDQLTADAVKFNKKMAKKQAKLDAKAALMTDDATAPAAQQAIDTPAASLDEAEAKRLRKEAKKQKKRKAEEMLAGAPSAAPVASSQNSAAASEPIAAPLKSEQLTKDEAAAQRAAKKAAKKDAKRALQSAADLAPPEAPAPEHKPAAKSKPSNKFASASSDSITKNFYQEHASVKSMSQADIDAHRTKLGITISEPEFRPLTEFTQAGFSSELLKCCSEFKQPSPIQSQCWPVVLSGRDCVAIAETGKLSSLACARTSNSSICAASCE